MITLPASLWSRIDAGEDTGEESGSRGENGGGDADELFPRYKQELWSIYVAVHAPLFPPFFFPSFRSLLFDGTSSGDIRNLLGRGKVRVERENDLNNV